MNVANYRGSHLQGFRELGLGKAMVNLQRYVYWSEPSATENIQLTNAISETREGRPD